MEISKCAICNKPTPVYYGENLCYPCYVKQDQLKRVVDYNLPEYYKQFSTDYRDPQLLQSIIDRFIQPDNNKGIYLYGPCGVGKTHIAVNVYRKIKSFSKHFLISPELFLEIKDSFSEHSSFTEGDIINEYCKIEYLFLDDFAAEKISDFTIETIYLLLDRRLRTNKHKLFFTSNLSLSQIQSVMSDRIASRIVELCSPQNIIKIMGDDYRLTTKGGQNG